MNGRFDYIKYDEQTIQDQQDFKLLFQSIEGLAEKILPNSRPKSLLFTALEEAYMWTGKALRDRQIERNKTAEEQPGRTNA